MSITGQVIAHLGFGIGPISLLDLLRRTYLSGNSATNVVILLLYEFAYLCLR